MLALLCRSSPTAREQIRSLEALRIVVSEFLAIDQELSFQARPAGETFHDDYAGDDEKAFAVLDDERASSADGGDDAQKTSGGIKMVAASSSSSSSSSSSGMSDRVQMFCMAAYSLTYLAASFEDQEVFRALQGIPLLLRVLRQLDFARLPFLVVHNFAWALGVAIDRNTVSQAEVCNAPDAIEFALRLARHSQLKIRRKGMLVLGAMCQDDNARAFVRQNKVRAD